MRCDRVEDVHTETPISGTGVKLAQDPNRDRDRALARQAAALEGIERELKSLVRIHTVLNQNIVLLTEFIQARQEELDINVGGDTNAAE